MVRRSDNKTMRENMGAGWVDEDNGGSGDNLGISDELGSKGRSWNLARLGR
jgi:hypothetical protein